MQSPGPDHNEHGAFAMAETDLPSPELLRQLLDYEPETGALTWCERPREMFDSDRNWRSWNTRYAETAAFTVDHYKGYKSGRLLDRNFFAHRVIWAVMTGAWPGQEIDHINGVKRDNRWLNLRDVSPSINSRNSKRWAHNSSGHNGVSWSSAAGKWRAHLKISGRQKHLGLFADIMDAVAARKAAEAEFGFTERHGK